MPVMHQNVDNYFKRKTKSILRDQTILEHSDASDIFDQLLQNVSDLGSEKGGKSETGVTTSNNMESLEILLFSSTRHKWRKK